ncbi:glycosyltransferase family 2 protein [Photobacterium leiognathi]|uniref:glycosyltransferase family 2 protein n=1 Tax=Photobacterium leiognathi TaxID=553611 RepID=UPI003DA1898E
MKISIVTVCYNAESCIDETILSVINQTYNNIEYVIVDGASKDDTIKIINKYVKYVDIFISEKDNGIYDAMNKALDVCTGEYVYFLNAGDKIYSRETIELIIPVLKKEYDIVYGGHVTKYPNEEIICKPLVFSKIEYGMIFNHQSVFVKSSIMKRNKFSIDKLSADYEFFFNQYLNNASFKSEDQIISIFNPNGVSSMNKRLIYKEWMDISLKGRFSLRKYIFLYLRWLVCILRT